MSLRSSMLALGVAVSSSALVACGGATDGGRVSIVLSSSAAVASAPATYATGATGAVLSSIDCQERCALPQAASVTFSSILARTLDGKLVDVTIDLPVTVDLLALVNGKQATLPAGLLPAGTYDQFVVVMTGLELTLASGTKLAITPPGGGWTAVVPVSPPFTVTAGETTTIPLTFRSDLSFGCVGDWEFHPAFECGHHDGDHDD